MSDRSYLQLVIYACPPDQESTLRRIIDENGLARTAPGEPLIGEWFDEESPLGAYDEIADALIAAAPGCAFACWNNPKYEIPGGLTQYHPTLGAYHHDCDAYGEPTFTQSEVERFLRLQAPRLELGLPWRDAFRALIPTPA